MAWKSKFRRRLRIRGAKARAVVSLGLCFVMTAAVALMLAVLAIWAGMGSQKLFLASVSDTEYYEQLAEELTDNLIQQLANAGLPEKVADGVIEGDEAYMAGTAHIKLALEGEDAAIDTTKVKEKLRRNIRRYLESYDLPQNDALDRQVEHIIAQAAQDYERRMELPAAELYRKWEKDLRDAAGRIVLMCAVCMTAAAAMLWALYHKKYHALRYVDYAVLGGSLTAGAVHFYTYRQLQAMPVLMDEGGYSRIMSAFFAESFRKGWFLILSGVCIWLVLLYATEKLRKERI